MNLTQRLFALAALGALALSASGGSGTDPIVGTYDGTAFYVAKVSIEGVPGVFQELSVVDPLKLRFEGEADAIAQRNAAPDTDGSYKRKGARYSADFTPASSEVFATDTGDPNAKFVFKLKRIEHSNDGVLGRVLMKLSYRSDLVRIRQIGKGTFGALATGS